LICWKQAQLREGSKSNFDAGSLATTLHRRTECATALPRLGAIPWKRTSCMLRGFLFGRAADQSASGKKKEEAIPQGF
jgi:hypothetical protein